MYAQITTENPARFVTPAPTTRTEMIIAIREGRDAAIESFIRLHNKHQVMCASDVRNLRALGPTLTAAWKPALEFAQRRLRHYLGCAHRGPDEAEAEKKLGRAIEAFDLLVDDHLAEHGAE